MSEYQTATVVLQGLVLIAAVTTVVIYYRQLKAMERAATDGANANRKLITFQMLERWNSDSMATARAFASPVVSNRYTNDSTPIFLGDLFHAFREGAPAEAYQGVSTLSHFFADLNSLRSEGAVDDRLACALFFRPIQFWFHYLRLVDSRTNADDDSKDALNANRWRQYALLPLARTVAHAQARTGYVAPFTADEIGLRF